MKHYPDINYDYRPDTYWDDPDVLSALLRNVKGTLRRQMVTDYLQTGQLEELEDELLKDTLSPEARASLGRIDPAFMGGEYLPDYHAGEVEIARIELQSTTCDVKSIRASLEAKGIRYRIVDEYESGYKLPFKTTRFPITLKRLVTFIERGVNPLRGNELNARWSGRESMRDFTQISSVFYPQLEEHYEHVFDDWVNQEKSAGSAAEVEK